MSVLAYSRDTTGMLGIQAVGSLRGCWKRPQERDPHERQYPRPIRVRASGTRLRSASHLSIHRGAYSTIAPSAEATMETVRQLQAVREER
jgi:hypothetical protein